MPLVQRVRSLTRRGARGHSADGDAREQGRGDAAGDRCVSRGRRGDRRAGEGRTKRRGRGAHVVHPGWRQLEHGCRGGRRGDSSRRAGQGMRRRARMSRPRASIPSPRRSTGWSRASRRSASGPTFLRSTPRSRRRGRVRRARALRSSPTRCARWRRGRRGLRATSASWSRESRQHASAGLEAVEQLTKFLASLDGYLRNLSEETATIGASYRDAAAPRSQRVEATIAAIGTTAADALRLPARKQQADDDRGAHA